MLKKLIEDISLKAEEVRDNLAEKDRLESEINEICKNNYDTIIYPVLKEYSNLLNYLGKCVRDKLCIWNEARVTHDKYTYYGVKLTTQGKDAELYIKLEQSNETDTPISTDTNDAKNISWRYSTDDIHMDLVHDRLLTIGTTNRFNIMFINEDACSKFLDAIDYILAKRLEYYMGGFDETNSELISRIKELVDILKAGHVPVSKEDGTVEVMIGGKKFVGKLEEDTDGADDN